MVYFIKANDKLKIGYANDPTKRIINMQVTNPYKLEVLLIIDGAYDLEKDLHKRFRESRLIGEWFELTDEIKEYIADNHSNDRKYEFGFDNHEYDSNQKIKRIRKRYNMSLQTLADLTNMTKQSVKELEKREELGTITIKSIKKLCNALGYEFEYRFIKK